MDFIKTLRHYSAILYPGKSESEGRINLYCDDCQLHIIFRSTLEGMPDSSYDESKKIGVVYEDFGRFPYYIDLVRNEKPIHVSFNTDTIPPAYMVLCSYEKPGRDEM